VLARLVDPGQALAGVRSSLDVLAFFLGLLLLANCLHRQGALTRSLDWLERRSGRSPRRLLLAVVLATAAVSAVLSNDAVALLLAPELLARLRARRLPLGPFVVAIAVVANAASLLLPISNPVNLLILDRTQIPLGGYVATVTPPALLALAITCATVLLLTRGLPATVSAPAPVASRGRGGGRGRLLWALLLALVVADGASARLGLPIGVPTLAAGLVALWLTQASGGARGVLGELNWGLLALVLGFSILAAGLAHAPGLAHVSKAVVGGGQSPRSALLAGLATAGLSGLVNNLPAALLANAALASSGHLGQLALAVVVGADLGPNLIPIGSLSTILILEALRRQGEPVPWRRFLAVGAPAALLALVPCLLLLGLRV
ncbi:MAG: SLC13 family permease, partial [Candidatus Dormibacteria bacterium]